MPNQYTKNNISPEQRFLKYVNKTDSCWLWIGGVFSGGYACFWYKNKSMKASHFSALLHKIPNPDNKPYVCHNCYPNKDNPLCVNPKHLFWGTPLENMLDKIKKGNQPSGENIEQSKLKEYQVVEIRKKYIPYKYTISKLAKEYRVHTCTIKRIIHRKQWKHI